MDKTTTIEISTDDSKNGKVGAAAVIYEKGNLVHRVRSKLHDNCSNIQEEQVAIISATKNEDELFE